MIEVSVCPVSSWSSRREAAALDLLRRDDPLHDVPGHALGEVDRDRGARGERLREPEVVVGEVNVGAARLVVRRDHSDRAVADDERDPQARPGREPAVEVVVDGRAVGIGALAAAAAEHARRYGFPRAARARRGSLARLLPRPRRSEAAPTRRGAARPRPAHRAARAGAPRRGRGAAAARSRSRARFRPRSATRDAATSASPRAPARASRRAA